MGGCCAGQGDILLSLHSMGGGLGGLAWLLNISRAHGEFLPWAILIQVRNENVFPELTG